MRSQLRLLLWKEWRERRVPFWLCLAYVLGNLALGCLLYYLGFTELVNSQGISALLGFVHLAPIFVAMRTALGETRDRTRTFSDALPASIRLRGWIRLLGGLAVLLVPIFAAILLTCLGLAGEWLRDSWSSPDGCDLWQLLRQYVCLGISTLAIFGSISTLYCLLAWLGTRLRTETHLGFAGAVVTFLWFLLWISNANDVLWDGGYRFLVSAIRAVNPGLWTRAFDGISTIPDLVFHVAGPMVANLILQAGLAWLFVDRYACQLTGGVALPRSRTKPARRVWLTRLPSPGWALTWLTLRQGIPMSLAGLAVAGLWAITLASFDLGTPLADVLPISLMTVGLGWAIVVGAGIFSGELDGRCGEFWRTRPIRTGRLFALKFIVGLFTVLAVLDGTARIAIGVAVVLGFRREFTAGESLSWPMMHALVYALAVAWTCVLRRAALGGLAALASCVTLYAVLSSHSGWLVGIVIVAITMAAAAVAYGSLRRYRPAL